MERAGLHPAVEEWFEQTFPGPPRAQERAWPEIRAGRSTLLLAPTGRAAKRMGEVIGRSASTIHRHLYNLSKRMKEGFAEVALRRGYYPRPGGGREDAVIMARAL